jgi:cytochrome c2
MTLTKVVGGFCGALLFFLLGQWAAELIYHGGGHGEHEQAYVIDTGEEEEAPAEEETGPKFAQLFVEADAGKGERVFNQCRACHALEEGVNGVGPYLHGVVGREVGAAEGYASYSGSLSEAADEWTPRELNAFLENPSEYAPGTTMGYSGLDSVEDRANVIAYLDQTDGDTYEIEVAAAEETGADAQTDAAMAGDSAAEPAAEDAGQMDFAAMAAAADPADGEKVWRQCQACHVADEEQNRVGPHMVGVVGREVASVEGFNYSDALMQIDGDWTPEKLNAWLENPSEYAPGTTMGYAGLQDVEDRAAVVAFMAQTSGGIDAGGGADADGETQEDASAEEATGQGAESRDTAGAATDGADAQTAEADAGGAGEEMAAAQTDDGAPAAEGGDAPSGFAAKVAAADPAEGKSVYRQCQACHVADDTQNRVGPHLVDTVGREVASVDSFSYSGALQEIGGKWTLDKLNAWLENPMDYAPGTTMGFAGLQDEDDRAAVIAYLQSLSN